VDDGVRVALVRAKDIEDALNVSDASSAHAAWIDPDGDPMLLWVEGEPIGLRE